MEDNDCKGWQKLLTGYPWLNVDGSYPLTAYSEYMPPPKLGRKPLGKVDYGLFPENDPYGWLITEMEEEYELRPGIEHVGRQIMSGLMRLGKGLTEHVIHGHGGLNLKDNPYWPPELALRAGTLDQERYVALASADALADAGRQGPHHHGPFLETAYTVRIRRSGKASIPHPVWKHLFMNRLPFLPASYPKPMTRNCRMRRRCTAQDSGYCRQTKIRHFLGGPDHSSLTIAPPSTG